MGIHIWCLRIRNLSDTLVEQNTFETRNLEVLTTNRLNPTNLQFQMFVRFDGLQSSTWSTYSSDQLGHCLFTLIPPGDEQPSSYL